MNYQVKEKYEFNLRKDFFIQVTSVINDIDIFLKIEQATPLTLDQVILDIHPTFSDKFVNKYRYSVCPFCKKASPGLISSHKKDCSLIIFVKEINHLDSTRYTQYGRSDKS